MGEFATDFQMNYETAKFANPLDRAGQAPPQGEGAQKEKKSFFKSRKEKSPQPAQAPHPQPDDKVTLRMQKLLAMVNRQLRQAGVPEIAGDVDDSMGDEETAAFSGQFWRLKINKKHLGDDANLPLLANAAYHESRHAEQFFRVARKMAGEGKAQEIGSVLSIDVFQTAKVADAAAKNPLTDQGTAEWQEAAEWEEDVKAARDPNKNKTSLFDKAKATWLSSMQRFDQTLQDVRKKYANDDEDLKAVVLLAIYTPLIQAFSEYGNSAIEKDAWQVGGKVQKALGGEPATVDTEFAKLVSVASLEKMSGSKPSAIAVRAELEKVLQGGSPDYSQWNLRPAQPSPAPTPPSSTTTAPSPSPAPTTTTTTAPSPSPAPTMTTTTAPSPAPAPTATTTTAPSPSPAPTATTTTAPGPAPAPTGSDTPESFEAFTSAFTGDANISGGFRKAKRAPQPTPAPGTPPRAIPSPSAAHQIGSYSLSASSGGSAPTSTATTTTPTTPTTPTATPTPQPDPVTGSKADREKDKKLM